MQLFNTYLVGIGSTDLFVKRGIVSAYHESVLCAQSKTTNGPVNAHLISGPSISTKHTKPG